MRAKLARGTLDHLGLLDVPVAAGTDGGSSGHDTAMMESVSYLASPGQSHSGSVKQQQQKDAGTLASDDGLLLALDVLRKAEDKSITVVVVSSLKDVASWLRREEELMVAKVKQVVIQGGVTPFTESTEYLEPDTAHNNQFSADSSAFFYRRCQEIGLPLLVVSRFSAYAAKVPRSIYDTIAASGNPIGRHLQKSQRTSIEQLWARACAPEGSQQRGGLPARCDKEWFCNTFCDGSGQERGGAESIWDCVISFNMYDPLALVAAIAPLEAFFDFDEKVVKGTPDEAQQQQQQQHRAPHKRMRTANGPCIGVDGSTSGSAAAAIISVTKCGAATSESSSSNAGGNGCSSGLRSTLALYHGLSSATALPGAIDIVVHEILGHVASAEGVVKSIRELRSRPGLLSPRCKLVPRAAGTLLAPCSPLSTDMLFNGRVERRAIGPPVARTLHHVLHFPEAALLCAPQRLEWYDFDAPSLGAGGGLDAVQRRVCDFEVLPSGELPSAETSEGASGAGESVADESGASGRYFDGLHMRLRVELDEHTSIDTHEEETTWECLYVRLLPTPLWLPAASILRCTCTVDATTDAPWYSIVVSYAEPAAAHNDRDLSWTRLTEYTWGGDG